MIVEAKRRKEERREKRRRKIKGKKNNNNDVPQKQFSTTVADVLHPNHDETVTNDKKNKKKRKRTEQFLKNKNHKQQHDDDKAEEESDAAAAAAIRTEDEEIALLEKKLGIQNDDTTMKQQALQKLNREYAKLEGYGDDFGDFLLGLDSIWNSSHQSQSYHSNEESEDGFSSEDDEPSEELIPMKEPQESSSSSSANNFSTDEEEEFLDEEEDDNLVLPVNGDEDRLQYDEEENQHMEYRDKRDISMSHTYTPSKGQDIYGNSTEGPVTASKGNSNKYIPPHMRVSHGTDSSNNNSENNVPMEQQQQQLVVLQRSLNGMLNRLAESSMDTVVMQIMKLYNTEASWKVNQCFTERLLQVCVHPTQLMTTLIPTYAATVAAIDCCSTSNSLGCHVLETVTVRYLDQQKQQQVIESTIHNNTDDDVECFLSNKEPANLILLITYLFNFNVVHCTFMYDVFRKLVQSSLNEVNVELLLLILQHAGYQLRSDDPTAMKEMVLLIQQQQQQEQLGDGISKNVLSNTSRRQYFLSAISDVKNNKKNNKFHQQHVDKLMRYRKFLGRMKSANGNSSSNNTCLRVTLQDILDIPTAGRWWRVGNAWKGNSFLGDKVDEDVALHNTSTDATAKNNSIEKEGGVDSYDEDDLLLKLAAKLGMNTDLRRSIFCVLMGSTDCEDAFEKLIKLKNGHSSKHHLFEREMIRVLVECCGNEKTYNPFYEMLAVQLCDSKSKKFTFQKTYWDLVFKPLDSLKARKAANLAKLAVHLVRERKMSISVLKVVDVTDLPESGVLFLAIFFGTLFQSCDSEQVGMCSCPAVYALLK
jgi:nucleolar MIF4G domain-containing protein 1